MGAWEWGREEVLEDLRETTVYLESCSAISDLPSCKITANLMEWREGSQDRTAEKSFHNLALHACWNLGLYQNKSQDCPPSSGHCQVNLLMCETGGLEMKLLMEEMGMSRKITCVL